MTATNGGNGYVTKSLQIPGDGLLNTKNFENVTPEPTQPTQEQIMAYMKFMRARHNAQCRKKGFKDHIHQPAGHKLERKLIRQGSLYGRLSLIAEMFKDIRERKFKEVKENLELIVTQTSTIPGTIKDTLNATI